MEDIKDFKWTDELVLKFGDMCNMEGWHQTSGKNNLGYLIEDFKINHTLKEKDIPKDWEIISFENKFGYLLLKAPDGTFGSDYAEESTLLSSSIHTIHSVKRNDGEVFTVGGKFLSPNGTEYTIDHFSIDNHYLLVFRAKETGFWSINSIRIFPKPKVPLFTKQQIIKFLEDNL